MFLPGTITRIAMDGIKTIPIDELKEFKKWNDIFTRVAYNPKTDVFIYERRNPEGMVTGLEVVKPRLRKGVRCYPSSEDFGTYGLSLSHSDRDRERAFRFLKNGF